MLQALILDLRDNNGGMRAMNEFIASYLFAAYLMIAVGNNSQYLKLCEVLGRPELGADALA